MGFSSAVASPFGLRPVRYLNGQPWTGAFNWYYRAAAGSAIGMYEPVATTGTAHATTGLKQVTRYTAGNPLLGVAVAFLPAGAFPAWDWSLSGATAYPNTLDYCPGGAGTPAMWIGVVDDPNVVFQAQEDGDTTPIVVASVGLNVTLITAADCNTTTGLSVAAIDSNTVNTTATLQLKILGLSQLVDGSNSISDNYKMFDVTINAHELGHGTGMTGI